MHDADFASIAPQDRILGVRCITSRPGSLISLATFDRPEMPAGASVLALAAAAVCIEPQWGCLAAGAVAGMPDWESDAWLLRPVAASLSARVAAPIDSSIYCSGLTAAGAGPSPAAESARLLLLICSSEAISADGMQREVDGTESLDGQGLQVGPVSTAAAAA